MSFIETEGVAKNVDFLSELRRGSRVERPVLRPLRRPLSENADAATDWENPYAPPENSTFVAVKNETNAPEIPDFFGAIFLCFKNYFNGKGRASRSEFWYFHLAAFLTVAVCVALISGEKIVRNWGDSSAIYNAFCRRGLVAFLVLFAPSLEVAIRRLQDRGRSGWLLALPAAALGAGAFGDVSIFLSLSLFTVCCAFLLVRFVLPGTPGENKYGPAPRRRKK